MRGLPASRGAMTDEMRATDHKPREAAKIFARNEVPTTAILDRLSHHLHIDGRSYRLRELDGLLQPQATPPSAQAERGGDRTQAGAAGAKTQISPECVRLGAPLQVLESLARRLDPVALKGDLVIDSD